MAVFKLIFSTQFKAMKNNLSVLDFSETIQIDRNRNWC